MTTFDLSYRDAVPLLVKATRRVHVMLVGSGGTGSWLAPDLARLACALRRADRQMDITFIDPDIVEERNVYRQNFCFAEVGRRKAITLAQRYSAAWGIEIRARAEPFDPGRVRMERDVLTVIVGCVDNAAARKSMAESLKHNQDVPQIWWLDVGNDRESGQLLLGSAPTVAQVRHAFENRAFCQCLPAPTLQEPALLEAKPDESAELSCAQMVVADTQSLTINKRMAAEAADYLCRLLGGGRLLRFATYLDLASGSALALHHTVRGRSRLQPVTRGAVRAARREATQTAQISTHPAEVSIPLNGLKLPSLDDDSRNPVVVFAPGFHSGHRVGCTRDRRAPGELAAARDAVGRGGQAKAGARMENIAF